MVVFHSPLMTAASAYLSKTMSLLTDFCQRLLRLPYLERIRLIVLFLFLSLFAGIVTPAQAQTNNAQFVSQTVPTSMIAGQSYQIPVTMTNNGTTTWNSAGSYGGYKLGIPNSANANWGINRVLLGTTTVAPGQSQTFTLNITAPKTTGTYNFQWQMVQENVAWFGAPTTNVSVNVVNSQTITFNPLSAQTMGTSPFALSATASSGLAVAFTSATPTVCTVSGTTVTLVAPGTCTINANQGGNTSYGSAPTVSQSFTISASAATPINNAQFVSQTVPTSMIAGQSYQIPVTMINNGTTTWNSAGSYGGYKIGIPNSANANWGINRVLLGTTTVAPGQSQTFTLNITAPKTTGTYNFQWQMVQENVAWFGALTTNVSVNVVNSQTITFNPLSAQTMGTSPFALSATASSGLAVAFTSATPTVCTVSGTTVTLVAPGTCTINANQSGNTSYGPAPTVSQSFTTSAATPTNNAQFVSQIVPATMTAGQSQQVSLTMTNIGTTIWNSTGTYGGYKLGIPNTNNANWGLVRALLGSATVAPGQSQTFTFNVTAPTTPGNYSFQWQMVQENVAWFGPLTPNISVTVESATSAQSLAYVYDALGRTIQSTDSTGFSNQFNYDTVGNISAAGDNSVGALSIGQFYPLSGTAGTAVTINGSGFNSSAADNTVLFNGVAATVSAASSTTLTAIVPATATSGKISVVNSSGSATSSGSFSVGPTLLASSTPTAANLTANQPATYYFSGTVNQGFILSFTGISFASSGSNIGVTVTLPSGAAWPAASCTVNADMNCVLPYLPATGTYTVTLTAPSAAATTNLAIIPDAFAGLSAGVPVTFAPSFDQAGTYRFTGNAGQGTQLVFTADSIYGNTQILVYNPDGSQLTSSTLNASVNASGAFALLLPTLTASGTYTVRLIPPVKNAAGNISLVMAQAITGTVTSGATPLPLTLGTGQEAIYTFSGSAGQSLGIGLSALAMTPANGIATVIITDPSGASIGSFNTAGTTAGMALPVLTKTGIYTVSINPGMNAAAFNLLLSADVTGTLPTNGTAVNFSSTRPGQAASYTFTGTQNQNVALDTTNDTFVGSTPAYIYEPSQSSFFASFSTNYSTGTATTGSTSLNALPVSGTYTVRLMPQNGATGSISLAQELEQTGALTLNGLLPMNLSPQQEGSYTFNGAVGENLGLAIAGVQTTPGGGTVTMTVLNPDSTTLASLSANDGSTNSSQPPTLSQNGVYTVLLNSGANAASASIWVTTDITASLNLNGTATPIGLSVPGRVGLYTFSASASQLINMSISGDTIPGTTTFIIKNNGNTIASTTATYSGSGAAATAQLMLPSLPVSGNYTIQVIPANGATGNVAVALAVTATGALPVNSAFAVSLIAGQEGEYTFNGTAQQILGLAMQVASTSPTGGTVTMTILNPDGTTLTTLSALAGNTTNGAPPTLTQTGVYTVWINPGNNAANLNVWISTDVVVPLTVDGPAVQMTLSQVNQVGLYTFSANAGETVTLSISGDTIPDSTSFTVSTNGTVLNSITLNNGSGTGSSGTLVLKNLPVTGTYTIEVMPLVYGTNGSVSIALESSVGGVLGINSSTPVSLELGQQGNFTFTGAVGQNLGLAMTNVTTSPASSQVTMNIIQPDGTSLGSFGVYSGETGAVAMPTLTQSGTYTLNVNAGSNAANLGIWLTQDVQQSLTLNGPAVPVTLANPGQAATYTFYASQGTNVNIALSITGDTIPNTTYFYLAEPNGTELARNTLYNNGSNAAGVSSGAESLLVNVPVTGWYTIRVVPSNGGTFGLGYVATGATGSVSVSISN